MNLKDIPQSVLVRATIQGIPRRTLATGSGEEKRIPRVRIRKDATRQGNHGKTLERIVKDGAGIPITQVPQSARVIRKDGKTFTQRLRGPVDFYGCINGRLLVFDAKESGLAHRLQTSNCHLPPHQRDELVRYGLAGALAGLLVMRTTDGAIFWCGWRLIERPAPSVAYEAMTLLGQGGPVNWFAVERTNDAKGAANV